LREKAFVTGFVQQLLCPGVGTLLKPGNLASKVPVSFDNAIRHSQDLVLTHSNIQVKYLLNFTPIPQPLDKRNIKIFNVY
jgi:hypothetical protein